MSEKCIENANNNKAELSPAVLHSKIIICNDDNFFSLFAYLSNNITPDYPVFVIFYFAYG